MPTLITHRGIYSFLGYLPTEEKFYQYSLLVYFLMGDVLRCCYCINKINKIEFAEIKSHRLRS